MLTLFAFIHLCIFHIKSCLSCSSCTSFLLCLTPLTRLLPLLLSNVPPSPSPQLRPPSLSSGGASDVAAAPRLPWLWSSPKLWRSHREDCPVSPGLTKHVVVYPQFLRPLPVFLMNDHLPVRVCQIFRFFNSSRFVLCSLCYLTGICISSQLYIDLHVGCCNSLVLIILHRPCMNTQLV